MAGKLGRREFLGGTAAACVLGLAAPGLLAAGAPPRVPGLVSPGCRGTKVRVGRIYMGTPGGHWPTPKLDLKAEVQAYEARFGQMSKDLSDVDFVVSELVTSQEQMRNLGPKLADVDGILLIHLSMGIGGIVNEVVSLARPTVLFAVPYSGHEWTWFGSLRQRKENALLDCMLTSDYNQLAVAIRPFRAIHHLREAKILDITKNQLPTDYVNSVKAKFGTEIKRIDREQVLAAYNAVSDAEAQAETQRWMSGATKIVEPPKEEIFKSCKLALAFQRMVDQENATLATVDCYGSMWRQLPAYPCLGLTRLDDMGLAGTCESDLSSAVTSILFQGLAGRPGFVTDPTVDESKDAIILAHCRAATKMDGPDGPQAPYKLRTIMERQEGAVAQVKMRIGERVTQAELLGTDLMLYFTGTIIETPDLDRGCRTKITVKVDGDIEKLWQNWSNGLHRTTCYGDLTKDLRRFCKFKQINLVNEA